MTVFERCSKPQTSSLKFIDIRFVFSDFDPVFELLSTDSNPNFKRDSMQEITVEKPREMKLREEDGQTDKSQSGHSHYENHLHSEVYFGDDSSKFSALHSQSLKRAMLTTYMRSTKHPGGQLDRRLRTLNEATDTSSASSAWFTRYTTTYMTVTFDFIIYFENFPAQCHSLQLCHLDLQS